MATKQDQEVAKSNSSKSNSDGTTDKIPESAMTNGQKNGEGAGVVGEAVETSFNERTAVRQPFILENGQQDNGARDLDKIDGARGESTRLGNNTVREDTRQAIKDGKIPASDQPEGTLKGEEEPAKNPVK